MEPNELKQFIIEYCQELMESDCDDDEKLLHDDDTNEGVASTTAKKIVKKIDTKTARKHIGDAAKGFGKYSSIGVGVGTVGHAGDEATKHGRNVVGRKKKARNESDMDETVSAVASKIGGKLVSQKAKDKIKKKTQQTAYAGVAGYNIHDLTKD
jgi:hypothetical protein